MNEIINKIQSCKSISELNDLRLEVFRAMKKDNGKNFYFIQDNFARKMNKLKRVPLKDRR